MRPSRMVRALLAVLLGSVVLSGCDFDVYKLPLPGGTDVGKDPITVTVMFGDVLDLVPKSTVKVNDVNVGQVSDVSLDGFTAKVTLELRNDTKLPDNALAEIRQTSLLGEKFVSLAAPETGASTNPLGNGDVIPLARSGRNPEIEEVLGALSLVLNGGGVAQLRTISQELNAALGGREDAARSVLTQVDTLTGALDTNKEQIVAAIEALNRLALSASKQLPTIDKALEELPSALDSIDKQRADLVTMLQALDNLSDVGVGVIQQSKASTIEAVRQLQPVLTQLAASGDDFVNAFSTFYAYPFVDESVGRDPQVARNLHMGDYTNLDAKIGIDLSGILPTALPSTLIPLGLPKAILDQVTACLQSGNPLSAACVKLVGNQVLIDYCKNVDNKNTDFCKLVNPLLIGLPTLPSGLPTLPLPSLPLPSLPLGNPTATSSGLLGGLIGGLLPRAGTGWAPPSADGRGGPTLAQLQQVYDPDLVNLMIPGMVESR